MKKIGLELLLYWSRGWKGQMTKSKTNKEKTGTGKRKKRVNDR